jgi:phosphatidylserine decarboxylase
VPITTGAGTSFSKGAELGRFNMGSTVILLFAAGRIAWSEQLRAACSVSMGQAIGSMLAEEPTTADASSGIAEPELR